MTARAVTLLRRLLHQFLDRSLDLLIPSGGHDGATIGTGELTTAANTATSNVKRLIDVFLELTRLSVIFISQQRA